MNTEVVGEIYRGAGAVLQDPGPRLESVLSEYKEMVRKAGKEIVKKQCLSKETSEALEKPLMPDEEYITMANNNINRLLPDQENT